MRGSIDRRQQLAGIHGMWKMFQRLFCRSGDFFARGLVEHVFSGVLGESLQGCGTSSHLDLFACRVSTKVISSFATWLPDPQRTIPPTVQCLTCNCLASMRLMQNVNRPCAYSIKLMLVVAVTICYQHRAPFLRSHYQTHLRRLLHSGSGRQAEAILREGHIFGL